MMIVTCQTTNEKLFHTGVVCSNINCLVWRETGKIAKACLFLIE